MADTDRGEVPAAPEDAETAQAWAQFEHRLAGYLATMTGEDDHLLLESPGDEGARGGPPYAQFAAYDDGAMLRAEVTGNRYLAHELPTAKCVQLEQIGWQLNWAFDEAAGADEVPMDNWSIEASVDESPSVARAVTCALRDVFGILHPQLLTQQAWGPAAAQVDHLDLVASGDVPSEAPAEEEPLAHLATDYDELRTLVGQTLEAKFDEEPDVDSDDDFVIEHMGQRVWVIVLRDQPVIEIMARVACGVRSRRAASVELGLLNRDEMWSRWILRDRDVWQVLRIPALPYVPTHLEAMIDCFLIAMGEQRDDLALRLGAQVE